MVVREPDGNGADRTLSQQEIEERRIQEMFAVNVFGVLSAGTESVGDGLCACVRCWGGEARGRSKRFEITVFLSQVDAPGWLH